MHCFFTRTSSVCIRLGRMASFMSTVNAPVMPCKGQGQGHQLYICTFEYKHSVANTVYNSKSLTRSSAVTGTPARLDATTMFPRRSLMSFRLVVNASTAIISDATVMSNWHYTQQHNNEVCGCRPSHMIFSKTNNLTLCGVLTSRPKPSSVFAWPMEILRSMRSFVSMTTRKTWSTLT